MIAALYVETGGVYFGLDGVDPWDEQRDARLYDGPWPVVAHPPCARWSIMGLCRGYGDGEDGGTFAHALDCVRRFGGVLEHPAHTLAWKRFHLPRPSSSGGWSRTLLDDGWSCAVDQRRYGHECRKPTWLYYVGSEPPPDLRWGMDGDGVNLARYPGSFKERSRIASRTPESFRDVLLSMARSAVPAFAL